MSAANMLTEIGIHYKLAAKKTFGFILGHVKGKSALLGI